MFELPLDTIPPHRTQPAGSALRNLAQCAGARAMPSEKPPYYLDTLGYILGAQRGDRQHFVVVYWLGWGIVR